jgi:restriction system protein
MAVPTYQDCMRPLLALAADGKERRVRDACDALADEFNLTEDEQKEMLPSGQQERYVNRMSWARLGLKKAGLLEDPRRGFFRITERGRTALTEEPDRIDDKYLKRYPEFLEYLKKSRKSEKAAGTVTQIPLPGDVDPEEALETAYQTLHDGLAGDVLATLLDATPGMFERIVVELLLKMGYGGSRRDAGRAVGKSGDEGIDGIINQDRLGLDVVYIQAKRWTNTVGRPEIQKFVGALQGKQANKGVFITTSDFSKGAREYAKMVSSNVVLIDGDRLAELMVEHDLGVSPMATYEVKRLDSDYFVEE